MSIYESVYYLSPIDGNEGEHYDIHKKQKKYGPRRRLWMALDVLRLVRSHLKLLPKNRGFVVPSGCRISWHDGKWEGDATRLLVRLGYGAGADMAGFSISATDDGGLVFEQNRARSTEFDGCENVQRHMDGGYQKQRDTGAPPGIGRIDPRDVPVHLLEHRRYIEEGNRAKPTDLNLVPFLSESLSDGEKDLLRRYWLWMEALAKGEIHPLTEKQDHFVSVAREGAVAKTDFERLWVKCDGNCSVGAPF